MNAFCGKTILQNLFSGLKVDGASIGFQLFIYIYKSHNNETFEAQVRVLKVLRHFFCGFENISAFMHAMEIPETHFIAIIKYESAKHRNIHFFCLKFIL